MRYKGYMAGCSNLFCNLFVLCNSLIVILHLLSFYLCDETLNVKIHAKDKVVLIKLLCFIEPLENSEDGGGQQKSKNRQTIISITPAEWRVCNGFFFF